MKKMCLITPAVPCGSVHGLHTLLPNPSISVSEVAVPPETCQRRLTDCPELIVLADAVRLSVNGTAMVTVCGPAVPPGPVAVSEKVVVALKGTTDEPDMGKGPESSGCGTAGVMVTEVAFVVAQVTVVVCPPPMVIGLAVNCVISGGGGGAPAT